jgi:hypothetical protein
MALIQPKLPLPRSNANTVLELLDDLKEYVQRDYRVVNMGNYICDSDPEDGGPACGTVGCFAGWTVLLAGCSNGKISERRSWVAEVAKKILGRDLCYTFGPKGRQSFFNAGRGDACGTTKPGTQAHADALVARINRFIKRNGGRKALQARVLKRQNYAEYLDGGR